MSTIQNLLKWRHGTLPSVTTLSTRGASNSLKKFRYDSLPIVIQTHNAPIHLYASEVEEKAMAQVYALANSDIPVGPVAIMPDVHWGKGSVVGAVFANKSKICPMAVGVDIGCGMTAVRMKGLRKHHLDRSMKLKQRIQRNLKSKIPVGFNSHLRPPPNAWKTLQDIAQDNPNCAPSNWLHRYIQRDAIIQHQLGLNSIAISDWLPHHHFPIKNVKSSKSYLLRPCHLEMLMIIQALSAEATTSSRCSTKTSATTPNPASTITKRRNRTATRRAPFG